MSLVATADWSTPRRQSSEWVKKGHTSDWWYGLDTAQRNSFINSLSDDECESFMRDWLVWASDYQLPPEVHEFDWDTWLFLAGRGAGKTRSAVEFLLEKIESSPIPLRIAIVGQGEHDIRTVMVEGESGFINCAPPWNKPIFKPTVGGGTLIFPNGSRCFIYSAADSEGLRGPQFHYGWFDEPMAVPRAQRMRSLDNLEFCLRLGEHPQLILTTTPKKDAWLRQMEKDAADRANKIHISRATTHDNARNLAANFLRKIDRKYAGTRIGKQEIEGKILGDEDGALWTIDSVEASRKSKDQRINYEVLDPQEFAATCDRVIVAIDPNTKDQDGKKKKTAHAAGIVVCAKRGGERFVLADRSVSGGPTKWAAAAVKAAIDFDAYEFVAEANQGGDMIRTVLKQANAPCPVHLQYARQDKAGRAEPVATMYDKFLVHHVGPKEDLERLEEQMMYLHEESDPTGEDFDRVDAMVWGMKRLGLKKGTGRDGKAKRSGTAGFRSFGEFNGQVAVEAENF